MRSQGERGWPDEKRGALSGSRPDRRSAPCEVGVHDDSGRRVELTVAVLSLVRREFKPVARPGVDAGQDPSDQLRDMDSQMQPGTAGFQKASIRPVGPAWRRAKPAESAVNKGDSPVEPVGIEPTTSCLQIRTTGSSAAAADDQTGESGDDDPDLAPSFAVVCGKCLPPACLLGVAPPAPGSKGGRDERQRARCFERASAEVPRRPLVQRAARSPRPLAGPMSCQVTHAQPGVAEDGR